MDCRKTHENKTRELSLYTKKIRPLLLFTFLLLTLTLPICRASAVNFESNGNGLYVHPKSVASYYSNKFANNNYAWTTDPGATTVETNTNNVTTNNAPKHFSDELPKGHHYYTGIPEEIYIGMWENKTGSQNHYCYHNADGNARLDFQDGSGYIGSRASDTLKAGHSSTTSPHICEKQYNLPYWAHCSDCGEAIVANVYAKASTLQNINRVPNGSWYYYLCPYSIVNSSHDYTRGHMEQGTVFKHQCSKMQSVNRYRVQFNPNFIGTANSGTATTEEWFYYTDSTSSVLYEGANIAFNSEKSFPTSVSWTSNGYVFAGWTTGDGTVVKNYEE